MDEVSLVAAFGAGLLSFLSPCVLPLVPVYLASLYGPEIFDPAASPRRFTVFLHALSFVAGFSVIFALMGAAVGLTGVAIGGRAVTRQVSGILLVVMGAFMLAAWKVPMLNFEKALSRRPLAPGYLRSVFTGGIFSLAWTPCLSPVLGGVLALALGSQTAWQGAYLLAIYSLGMGLPFLAVGIFFDYLSPQLRRLHRYSSVFYLVSAALLIIMGVLVLTNTVTWFQSQFGG